MCSTAFDNGPAGLGKICIKSHVEQKLLASLLTFEKLFKDKDFHGNKNLKFLENWSPQKFPVIQYASDCSIREYPFIAKRVM